MNVYEVWILCTLPSYIYGVSLEIEGLIDLGSKWNYEYKISRPDMNPGSRLGTSNEKEHRKYHELPKSKEQNKKHKTKHRTSKHEKVMKLSEINETHDHKNKPDVRKDKLKSIKESITKKKSMHSGHKLDGYTEDSNGLKNKIFIEETFVRDNSTINQFIVHVYNQALKLFDKIKQLIGHTDNGEKYDVEKLKNIYKEMFGVFLNHTQDHRIRTNLGPQKVIKNIISTSNSFVRRLTNTLRDGKHTMLINNEINKLEQFEEAHICKKFNICRSSEEYSDYAIAVLKEMFLFRAPELKHAVDTATEILKNTDYSRALSSTTQDQFRQFINKVETMPLSGIRGAIGILINTIRFKDKPIIVISGISNGTHNIEITNVTVLFREMTDILNNNAVTEEKKRDWDDTKSRIKFFWLDSEYIVNKYNQDIMAAAVTKMVTHFKDVVDTVDHTTAEKIDDIMKRLLEDTKFQIYDV